MNHVAMNGHDVILNGIRLDVGGQRWYLIRSAGLLYGKVKHEEWYLWVTAGKLFCVQR